VDAQERRKKSEKRVKKEKDIILPKLEVVNCLLGL
jgi:hypothetical protein